MSDVSCADFAEIATIDDEALTIAGFQSRMVDHDGVPLRLFEGGSAEAPPLLVCMPHGTPVGVYHQMFEILLCSFRVITWESRGYPILAQDFDALDIGLDAHVSDAAFILDQCGLTRVHAIGLCSGAAVLAHLSARNLCEIERAVMFNGNLNLAELHPNTAFKTGMLDLLTTLSGSRKHARGYAAAFKSGSFSDNGEDLFAGAANADAVRDLQHRSFHDGETAFRYARMDVAMCSADTAHVLPQVKASTLLIGFLDNGVIPWEWSIAAVRLIPDARALIYAEGGHFAVCKRTDVIADAVAFLSPAHNG